MNIFTAQSSEFGLEKHGIKSDAVCYQASYDCLFAQETDPKTPTAEAGQISSLGAVSVDTGRYTGRSPKDKYIVSHADSIDHVWWHQDGSDNKPIDQETWQELKKIALEQVNDKSLYVMDMYCGADKGTRLKVRLVTEIAWTAHFFKNMFITPTEEELKDFEPDWTIINACKAKCDQYQQLGLNSPTFVAFNIEEKMTLIAGTWYGGEMKKGMFSMMNYFLPLKNIGSFHCSANQGPDGETALFFGLSGTGKTTLSADPSGQRLLIGDDEHGWGESGIFNLEGGCYAKTINLSPELEPDIYQAICQNALLENVVMDEQGQIDFSDSSKTENTRVSYPIEHIKNIVRPESTGTHPKVIIFLTCDAYGVLPPVSFLSKEQAMYQFLCGYTAKVAGTELGVKEPTACFSACFGQPFLLQHPTVYAKILGEKMEQHQTKAYLVNTGWVKGAYGVGERMALPQTRAIIDAILSGAIESAPRMEHDVFGFEIPRALEGVETQYLNPVDCWSSQEAYEAQAQDLAAKFQKHFTLYQNSTLGKELMAYGPKFQDVKESSVCDD